MKLTGAMIFYLLESEYKGTVTRGEEEAGTVENIRFLDESRCEEGRLYIAGEEQAGDWETGGKNISLVVCGVTKATEWCRLPCPAALVPYPAGEKQVFEQICGRPGPLLRSARKFTRTSGITASRTTA